MFKRDKIRLENIVREAANKTEHQQALLRSADKDKENLKLFIKSMDKRFNRICSAFYAKHNTPSIQVPSLDEFMRTGRINYEDGYTAEAWERDVARALDVNPNAAISAMYSRMHYQLNILNVEVDALASLLRVRVGNGVEYTYAYSDEFIQKIGLDPEGLAEIVANKLAQVYRDRNINRPKESHE